MKKVRAQALKKAVAATAIFASAGSLAAAPAMASGPSTDQSAQHHVAYSGLVVMTGQAQCGGMWWNPKASWLYINASNGERGWAWVDRNTGNWSYTLSNVPTYGTVVSASWGCPNGAVKSTQKSISRPWFGYSAYMSHWY